MNRNYKTEGIIVRRMNLGEADKLITLFSKHFGKIRLVAKGVRKIKSRKRGNLELFSQVRIMAARGRNLDLITEVEPLKTFKKFRQDLKRTSMAYYFCELVDRLTAEGQANKEIYNLLDSALASLDQTSDLPNVREFEESLLVILGFGVPQRLKNSSLTLRPYIEEICERKILSLKQFDL